jgi:phospholipase C
VWLAVAGCKIANTSGNTTASCQSLTPQKAAPPPGWGGTVFTIVMENKSHDDIFNKRAAPYINQLVKHNAVALGYHDAFVHPSEPNYIWMVAGQNFGVLDDRDPSAHHLDSTSHLADQIEAAGLTWKSYQEGMGEPCGLVSHGRYAAKHDPFVYFNDVNGWDGNEFAPSKRCTEHVVDYSQLDADLAAGKLPNYVFITPNLDHDMHDGSIEQGDAWLANEVPKILASAAFRNGGILFLLWDEGSGTIIAHDDPPFIAISPNAKPGFASKVDYSTTSYVLTVQKILGVSPLPCAEARASVASMDDLFRVPIAQQTATR